MSNTKASQLPQINKEQREKALEKKMEKEAKAKNRAKGKAKAKSNPKRKLGDESDDESFADHICDERGNMRNTLYGDDLLNAVNFTLEKIPARAHRSACISYSLDLGVLFALDSKLDAAGIPRHQVWTKARKHIKTYLNKTHALRARLSDPDEPLGHGQPDSALDAGQAGEAQDEADEDESVAILQRLAASVRISSDKGFISFLDDNFPDLSGSVCFKESFDLDSTWMLSSLGRSEHHWPLTSATYACERLLRSDDFWLFWQIIDNCVWLKVDAHL